MEQRLAQARIASVNVGSTQVVRWRGREFKTAIVKTPVVGSRRIEGVNVAGDDQGDRTVHGGPSKAVYAYSLEDYEWWSAQLGIELKPGVFGENLTTEGLDVNALPIGEQWRIGTALLEVSEPRIPCYKLGFAMDDPTFPKRFGLALRFGTYFRIVEEGAAMAGSTITFHQAAPAPTLASCEVGRIYMYSHAEKYRLAGIAALALTWRSWAVGLDKADADPERTSTSVITPTVP